MHDVDPSTFNITSVFPGQTVGLSTNIVYDPQKAMMLPTAKGFTWWCGIASTYFGFNLEQGLAVAVFGHDFIPDGKRTQAFKEVANMAHQILSEPNQRNENIPAREADMCMETTDASAMQPAPASADANAEQKAVPKNRKMRRRASFLGY